MKPDRFRHLAGFTVTDLMIVIAAAVILGAAIKWNTETTRYAFFWAVGITWLGAIVLVKTCLGYLKSGEIKPAIARPFIISPVVDQIGPRQQAKIALAISVFIVVCLPAYLLFVFTIAGR